MFVCVDDNGPRLVGWTTLEASFSVRHRYAHDPGRISALEPAPAPPAGEPYLAESGRVTRHEFATRTIFRAGDHRGLGLSAIILRPEQDPAVLPGWEPREEAITRVIARGPDEMDYELRHNNPTDFVELRPHSADSGDGLTPTPLVWCVMRHRSVNTVEVWPDPPEGYEIIVQRGRTFSFEPPRPPPVFVGVDLGRDPDYSAYLGISRDSPGLQRFLAEQHETMAEAMIIGQSWLRAAPAADGSVVWDNPPPPGGYRYGDALTEALHAFGADFLRPRIDPETAAQSRSRARGLLKSLLRPEQWAEFEQHGYVCERIGGTFFTLRPGGMIEVHKTHRILTPISERWCIAPDVTQEWLPPEDQLIGQLLHLRAGPNKLRKKASVFHG